MIHIEALEIRYFRSVYHAPVKNLRDVTVFSGRNDVGKSNLLKALNLFFNNETDWKTPFDFSRDFSKVRLNEVRKDTIRGKQYIQITASFLRGNRYEKSLPKKFTVTRTWTRDSAIPQTRSNLAVLFKRKEVPTKKLDRAEAALQRFLNTIRYEYVPAIKDHQFFGYMLSRLQDVIFEKGADDSGIAEAVRGLNESVVSGVGRLKEEFLESTTVPIDIRLPQQLGELFKAFAVSTTHGQEEMPLAVRGDGIRCRFLPSLLHYISSSSSLFHVWGFEEPENSLEHGLTTRLAHRMRDEYSKTAQVLVTSHSPAFFSLSGYGVSICRVARDQANNSTVPQPIEEAGQALTNDLERELGLLEFQKDFQKRYDALVAASEKEQALLKEIREKISSEHGPVVLTEGKWDVKILEEAWKRLFQNKQRAFRIISCATASEDDRGGAAGYGALKSGLESVRADQPATVGLFDRDNAGRKEGFDKLNKNFSLLTGNADIKVQRTGTAAAVILPVPTSRQAYADVGNLPLEFLFPDQFLEKEVQGKRLLFTRPKIRRHVDQLSLSLPEEESREPHHRRIVAASKKHFAEQVVPSLPDEAFNGFAAVFDLIAEAFKEIESLRSPDSRPKRSRGRAGRPNTRPAEPSAEASPSSDRI